MRKICIFILVIGACLFASSVPRKALAQSNDSWIVPVQVQIDTFDFQLYFGVQLNATDGFDAGIDTLAPPPGFTPHTIFSIPEFPNSLQADFRAPDTSNTWTLKTFNATNKTVHVSWDSSQVPSAGMLTMADSLDMSLRNSADFTGDVNLEIVFFSQILSVEAPTQTEIPETFVITSYPNPFTENVNFEITTGFSQPAVLRIFNILGQEIRKFTFQTDLAGIHRINWDGTDVRGRQVPNGLYFSRLELADGIGVSKLYRLR